MSAERVAMRQVREIVRLTFSNGMPGREIARRLGIAASTVRATLERFRSTGLACPIFHIPRHLRSEAHSGDRPHRTYHMGSTNLHAIILASRSLSRARAPVHSYIWHAAYRKESCRRPGLAAL